MKPSRSLKLNTEHLTELTSEELSGVAGASGWDPCGWPGNTAIDCDWSGLVTCAIC